MLGWYWDNACRCSFFKHPAIGQAAMQGVAPPRMPSGEGKTYRHAGSMIPKTTNGNVGKHVKAMGGSLDEVTLNVDTDGI